MALPALVFTIELSKRCDNLKKPTLGIKLADGTFFPVMEEDARARKRLVLSAASTGQNHIKVEVYRGYGESLEMPSQVGVLVLDPDQDNTEGEIELFLEAKGDGNISASANHIGAESLQSFSKSLDPLPPMEDFAEFQGVEEDKDGPRSDTDILADDLYNDSDLDSLDEISDLSIEEVDEEVPTEDLGDIAVGDDSPAGEVDDDLDFELDDMEDLGDIGTLGADPNTFDPKANIDPDEIEGEDQDSQKQDAGSMEDLGEVSLSEPEIEEVSDSGDETDDLYDFSFPEEEDQGLTLPEDQELGSLDLGDEEDLATESEGFAEEDSTEAGSMTEALSPMDEFSDLDDFSLEEGEDNLSAGEPQEAESTADDLSDFSMDDTENLELDEDLEMDSLSLEDGDDFSTEDTDELTESLSIDDGLGDVDLSAQEDAIDLSSEEEMGEAGFEGMEDDLEPLDLDSPEMDLSLDDDLSLDLDAEEEPALALSSGDDSLDYSVEEPDVDPLSLNNIPEPEPKEPVQSVAPTEVKKVSDDMSPKEKTFVVLMIASLVMAFSILVSLLLLHFIGEEATQPEVFETETPAYMTPENDNEGSYDLSISVPNQQEFPADIIGEEFTLRGEISYPEGTWESDRNRMESGSFFSGS
jgi:hypothetical protein